MVFILIFVLLLTTFSFTDIWFQFYFCFNYFLSFSYQFYFSLTKITLQPTERFVVSLQIVQPSRSSVLSNVCNAMEVMCHVHQRWTVADELLNSASSERQLCEMWDGSVPSCELQCCAIISLLGSSLLFCGCFCFHFHCCCNWQFLYSSQDWPVPWSPAIAFVPLTYLAVCALKVSKDHWHWPWKCWPWTNTSMYAVW